MDNFFASRPSQEELQRRHVQQRAQRRPQLTTQTSQPSLHSAPISPMNSDTPMVGGDSLDDIIRDNNVEFHRHRSLSQSYNGQMSPHNGGRRLSMVEFGGNDDSFRDYQFGGMANPTADGLGTGFSNVGSSIMIPGTNDTFSPQPMLSDDFNTISPEMMGNMIALSNMNMGPLNASASSMNFFDASGMPNTFQHHNIGNITPADYNMQMENEDSEMMNDTQGFSRGGDGTQQQPGNLDTGVAYPQSMPQQISLPAATNFQTQIQPPLSSGAVNATPVATAGPQPSAPKESKTIYSKSGFDMLRALWLVATRKGPQVNLGAVDMSCAFVVCDVSMNDCPIIYVSDNFQNLTGYSKHDIVGQNCRFLQAPDGKVEAGTKREFVDNGAVYNLKKKIAEGKEVQQSLINYRKGGKPFLNLLTMIPIPWDTPEIRYIIGFQIDLVECPDAIASGKETGSMTVNYKHSDIGQYIWQPPTAGQIEPENGQTLGADDVSTLLQQFTPKGAASDWHKQSWDKMLLENADDVVHVLSLKGLFLYLSPSCKRILEYDAADLVGTSISSICHPSDIVPVTRELKETTTGGPVSIVFRIRRKQSGYTWFESHGSLFVEQGKGRKCIILIGRKRPVLTLSRRDLESNSGIGDSELWTKLSTSGMFLFVSSNVRSLLDLQPDSLVGTSIQDLMRKESRPEFGRSIEKARRGRIVTCKHEVQNRRGQVLQAHTTLYPGDAIEGQKPTFLLAQTKLLKASSRAVAPAGSTRSSASLPSADDSKSLVKLQGNKTPEISPPGIVSQAGSGASPVRCQDRAMLSDDNIFDELKTTRCTSWQYELRQMEKINRVLAEELHGLLSNKKKRKRRKGVGNVVRDCANCHTRNTPEWRRGPSGQRDLCNSCGLRWAKQTGRVSPRTSLRGGGNNNGDAASKKSNSPAHSSPLRREVYQFENADAQPSDTASSTTANRSSVSSGGPSVGTSGTTPLGGLKGPSIPPPSQPSLAGGVPAGSEMTAI